MHYPLELRLKPSRRQKLALVALHLIAALAFIAASLADWLLIAVLSGFAISALLAWKSECGKSDCVLRLDDSGRMSIEILGVDDAWPLPGCTDFGWAVWLQWRAASDGSGRTGRTGAMMIVSDNLRPEEWRQLRIWLRHKLSVDAAVH